MENNSILTIIGDQPAEIIINNKNTITNYKIKINNSNNQDRNTNKDANKEYCKCYTKDYAKDLCFSNFYNHISSNYCITEYCAKSYDDKDPCCDIFMTCIFCPVKFIFTWPCCIGSVFNSCINKYKNTDKNYLC